MEIVRENEVFNVSDTKENGWKLKGTVNKNVSGLITINCTVEDTTHDSKYLGSFNYTDDKNISVNYSVEKEAEAEFNTYMRATIASVLESINKPL